MTLYLVTGGAGFIGSHIAEALVARGDRVRVLDDLSGGKRENLAFAEVGEVDSGAPIELLVGSVSERADVERACVGCAGVFHEAALVSVPLSVESPDESFRINVRGTFEVLRAAHAAGATGVVMASSAAIYGDDPTVPKRETMTPEPVSPYAGDKLTGETMLQVWARSFGLETVALRYFNVFGPRQADDSAYSGVIALFARKCRANEPVTIFGDGEQTRDFVYVGDVAQANLRAMDARRGVGFSVFNVGTGRSVSIRELYQAVAEDVARADGRGGSVDDPKFGPARVGDVKHSRADIQAIRTELGFEPGVSLSEGLARTLDWYRTVGG